MRVVSNGARSLAEKLTAMNEVYWTHPNRQLQPIDLIACDEEPLEALIACEVNGLPRTYTVKREYGGAYWVESTPSGAVHTSFASWYHAVKFFQLMNPSKFEVLAKWRK